MGKEYVAGFFIARVNGNTYTPLIEKKRGPRFLIGKWNAIGGSMEPGETSYEAMAREFLEETGVVTSPDQWETFAEIRTTTVLAPQEDLEKEQKSERAHHTVKYMRLLDSVMPDVKTMEDENVAVFNVMDVIIPRFRCAASAYRPTETPDKNLNSYVNPLAQTPYCPDNVPWLLGAALTRPSGVAPIQVKELYVD